MEYKSRSARDAQASGYGDRTYWDNLERGAHESHDYFMRKGDEQKAREMLTRTLSEALMGNDGD